MANDIVEIYNLALNAIGARGMISLPTEDSREAEACQLWYPNIRDQVLASASWPDATKMERLALISEQPDDEVWVQGSPTPNALYAYEIPTDCLRPQFVTNYSQFSLQAYGDERRALMTSVASPILVYTFRHTKPRFWSQELQMAIMYGLAAAICVPLTGKTSRAKSLLDQANSTIISARETAANMNNERFDFIPDWIAARGYGGSLAESRYVYPFGSLLSISNVN